MLYVYPNWTVVYRNVFAVYDPASYEAGIWVVGKEEGEFYEYSR
jgi:hypothetical protein